MNRYRVDLHVHTTVSGDGRSTLAEQINAAKRVGLHAIAVTDHNRCFLMQERSDGILLIPGCEVSSDCGHVLGLFLEREIEFPKDGCLPSGEEAVRMIRSAGGLAVLAHPFQQPWRNETDLPQDVDGIEVCNARGNLKRRNANALASELAEKRNVFTTAGSDAHHSDEVGYAYTEIDAEELSLESLKEAMCRKQCRPVLRKETSYTEKALSQWESAKKKDLLRRVKGVAYLCRGVWKDFICNLEEKRR